MPAYSPVALLVRNPVYSVCKLTLRARLAEASRAPLLKGCLLIGLQAALMAGSQTCGETSISTLRCHCTGGTR